MKGSKVHAILSEVYRLLSTYDAADFQRASEYGTTSIQVAEALRALAREAKDHGSEDAERSRDSAPISSDITTRLDQWSDQKDLLQLIRSSRWSESGRSILEFAKEFGIRVQANPKDSKDRLMRKVAHAIEAMPERRRTQATKALLDRINSQTEGWIDVIKNTRS